MKRVAVVLALAAFCACTTPHTHSIGGPVVVYRAKVEIPPGTDADTLASRGMVELIEVSRPAVQPGAISSLSEIQGKLALVDIPKGAQILAREFAAHSNPIPNPTRLSKSPSS